MVSTGLSEVIGSWNTMPMSRPRTVPDLVVAERKKIAAGEAITLPQMMRPGGHVMRRMMESALTDLPQPDSPTTATVSPGFTSKVMPSTALTTPSEVKKCVLRSWTSRSCSTGLPAADGIILKPVDHSKVPIDTDLYMCPVSLLQSAAPRMAVAGVQKTPWERKATEPVFPAPGVTSGAVQETVVF